MSHRYHVTSARTPWTCGISFTHAIVLQKHIQEVRALEYYSGMTLKRSTHFQSSHHFETSKIVEISTISAPIFCQNSGLNPIFVLLS